MLTATTGRRSLERLLTIAHTINSATVEGIDGKMTEVQARAVSIARGPKPIEKCVKGVPKQQLERIAAALCNVGARESHVNVTINIHDGAGDQLDLAIALAILQATGFVAPCETGDYMVFGKLDIHGQVRATDKALPLSCASRHGQTIIFPRPNSQHCLLAKAVRDIRLSPIDDLETAINILKGRAGSELKGGRISVQPAQKTPPDFADIIGQEHAKWAAEICAAGGHSLLMIGSPGCGKTMIANAIAGIMPPLENTDKVELTRIWSAAGMINDGRVVSRRPFRVVHHTTTKQALIGGGRNSLPGEVTLAHKGVLFLDEIAEFRGDVLETLRQPLEDGCVRISRVHGKAEYPSRFSLVAAMNPCPCGYAPECCCTQKQIDKYQSSISGPLLDRIDLAIRLNPVPLDAARSGESSAHIRKRVSCALEQQLKRNGGLQNAEVPGHKAIELFRFSSSSLSLLTNHAQREGISKRGMDRMAKVSRTIADIYGAWMVDDHHVLAAAEFFC